MASIPPEVLQQQANTTAPGVNLGPQDKAPQVAKTRKQPGQAGKSKTPAQKMYPKLASNANESGE
jgi:hypothetical protein